MVNQGDHAWLSWSGGKDAAFAYYRYWTRWPGFVSGLLTTVSEETGNIRSSEQSPAMLSAQEAAMALPMKRVPLPSPCSNEVYTRRFIEAACEARNLGASHLVFGDIALQDVRSFRETMLEGWGITGLYPNWGRPSHALAHEVIDAGIKALVVAVDTTRLDPKFLGRIFDHRLVGEMPVEIDSMGENGEFRTVVIDAPFFEQPIPYALGETWEQDGMRGLRVNPLAPIL